ncbi:hypothetical protein K439DRAFT_1130626 [Ramaria rubella]|nr:hypothetical protein K439DRAFT_1130626 [Ramaria rubella]
MEQVIQTDNEANEDGDSKTSILEPDSDMGILAEENHSMPDSPGHETLFPIWDVHSDLADTESDDCLLDLDWKPEQEEPTEEADAEDYLLEAENLLDSPAMSLNDHSELVDLHRIPSISDWNVDFDSDWDSSSEEDYILADGALENVKENSIFLRNCRTSTDSFSDTTFGFGMWLDEHEAGYLVGSGSRESLHAYMHYDKDGGNSVGHETSASFKLQQTGTSLNEGDGAIGVPLRPSSSSQGSSQKVFDSELWSHVTYDQRMAPHVNMEFESDSEPETSLPSSKTIPFVNTNTHLYRLFVQ